MIQSFVRAVLLSAILAMPSFASAGTYSDSLTRCLVENTTIEDQNRLVRWLVLAFAANSSVGDIVDINERSVDSVQREMAEYTNRVFLKDCLLEAREAVRYEGESALVNAFKFSSQVAGRAAMSDTGAAAMLEGYLLYLDEKRFEREILGK